MNIKDIKYRIEQSAANLPTLSIINESGKEFRIHSKYNPFGEAETLKEKFNPEKYNALIILGAGLGYHLLPLKEIKDKYKKIIIIDAINNINEEIVKNPETGFLTESGNIIFLTGLSQNEIQAEINNEIDFEKINGLDVIDHPSSVRAFHEYYSEVKKSIQLVINRKAGNLATTKAFGKLYLKNIFKNFNAFSNMYPVSAFFRAFSRYPVLVIVSGPSIENYIEEIKAHQNNFFIICAESALSSLMHNDIFPDFFLSIDPQPFIFEHVLNLTASNAIPIFTVSSHPFMLEKFRNSRSLISLNTHPVSQIIDDMFPGKIGHIDSKTGTVAGDAIMAANEFSFNTIGLVGFDFSFPQFKIYPRGTAYQKRFANASRRFNSIETINFNYVMKSSKGIKVDGKYTRKSFVQYKESIEKLIENFNNKRILNINNSGIPIKGIEHIELKSFIADFCVNKILKQKIIGEVIVKSQYAGDIVSFKKLNTYISEKNNFNEIINASFENKSENKIELYKSLFNNLAM